MNNSNAPRIYLSGPVTGIKDFNYPAFRAEAARLRALGYIVENPAENPAQSSWGDYMKVALRQMLTCDVIAVLPGWAKSRGAWLEVSIAERVGMEFCEAAEIKRGAVDICRERHAETLSKAYRLGWNAWLDSASQDDNPWTETTDSGCEWMRGLIDCEQAANALGTDSIARFP